ALVESKARLDETLEEARADAARSVATLEAAPDISAVPARLDAVASEVASDRARLADARAAHQGLAREAEIRRRRLETIEAERANWISRAANADRQLALLSERRSEAAAEQEQL